MTGGLLGVVAGTGTGPIWFELAIPEPLRFDTVTTARSVLD